MCNNRNSYGFSFGTIFLLACLQLVNSYRHSLVGAPPPFHYALHKSAIADVASEGGGRPMAKPYFSSLPLPEDIIYNKTSNMKALPGGGMPVLVDYHKRCSNNFIGVKPHPEQRQYYYVCNPKCVIFAKCVNLQTFNATSGQCESFPSNEIMPVCRKEGRFPIYTNCKLFYRCDCYLTPTIFTCPKHKVFSQQHRKCVEGHQCPSTEITIDGSYIPANCEEKFPPCLQNGIFRSIADCSLYYSCTLRSNNIFLQTRFKCPSGTFYDLARGMCLPQSEVPCDAIQLTEIIYPGPYHPLINSPLDSPKQYPTEDFTQEPFTSTEAAETYSDVHPFTTEFILHSSTTLPTNEIELTSEGYRPTYLGVSSKISLYTSTQSVWHERHENYTDSKTTNISTNRIPGKQHETGLPINVSWQTPSNLTTEDFTNITGENLLGSSTSLTPDLPSRKYTDIPFDTSHSTQSGYTTKGALTDLSLKVLDTLGLTQIQKSTIISRVQLFESSTQRSSDQRSEEHMPTSTITPFVNSIKTFSQKTTKAADEILTESIDMSSKSLSDGSNIPHTNISTKDLSVVWIKPTLEPEDLQLEDLQIKEHREYSFGDLPANWSSDQPLSDRPRNTPEKSTKSTSDRLGGPLTDTPVGTSWESSIQPLSGEPGKTTKRVLTSWPMYGSTQSQEGAIDISHSSTTLTQDLSSPTHTNIPSEAAFASSPKPGHTSEVTFNGTSVKGPTSTGLTAQKSTNTSSKKILESSTKSSSDHPGDTVLASSIKPLSGEPGKMTEKVLIPWNVYDSTQSQEGITDILHTATTVPANLSSLEHANIPSEALASSPKPGDTKETAFIGTSVKGPTATGLTVDKSTNIPHTNITTEDLSVVWIKPTLEPQDLQLEDKEHRKNSIGDLPANWLSDQPLSDQLRNTPEKSTKSTSDRESSIQPLSGEPGKTTKRVLTSWPMYGSTQSQEGVIDISHSSTTLTPDLSSPKHTNIPNEAAFISSPTPKETTEINFTGTSVKGPVSTGLTAEKSTDTLSKEVLVSSTKSSSHYPGEAVLASSIKPLPGEPGEMTEKGLTPWNVYDSTQSQERITDISQWLMTLSPSLSSLEHINIPSVAAFASSVETGETTETLFNGTTEEGVTATGLSAQRSKDTSSKEILESSAKFSSDHPGETVLASSIKPLSGEPGKTTEKLLTTWSVYDSRQSQEEITDISQESTTQSPSLSSLEYTNIPSVSAFASSAETGETTETLFNGTTEEGVTATGLSAQRSTDTSSKEILESSAKFSSDHPGETVLASSIKPLSGEPGKTTEKLLTTWSVYDSRQSQEEITDISQESTTQSPSLSSLEYTNIPSISAFASSAETGETTETLFNGTTEEGVTATGLSAQRSKDTSSKEILESSTKFSSDDPDERVSAITIEKVLTTWNVYDSTQSQEGITDISHRSATLPLNLSSLAHANIPSEAAFAGSLKPGDTKEITFTDTSVKSPTATGLTSEKSTDTPSKDILESSTKSSSDHPGEAVLASSIKPLFQEPSFTGTSVKGPTSTGLTVKKSTNIPHTNITTEDLSVVWIKPTLEPEDLQLEDLQIKEHRKYSIGDLPANWLSDQPLSDRPRNTPEKSTKSTSDRLGGPLTDTPIGTSWESSIKPLSGEPGKTMYGSTQSQEKITDISHSSTTIIPNISSLEHADIQSEATFASSLKPGDTKETTLTGTSVKGPTSTGLTAGKSTNTSSKEILESSTKSSSDHSGDTVLASSIKPLSGEPGKATEKVPITLNVYDLTQSQEGITDISQRSTTLSPNLSSLEHANIPSEALASSPKPGDTKETTFTGTSVKGPTATGLTVDKSTNIPHTNITTEDLSVVWIKPTLEPEDLQLEDLQTKEHRKYSIGDLPANWLSDQPLSDRPRNAPEKSTKSTSDRLGGPFTDIPIGTSWESSIHPLSGEPGKTTKRVLTSWPMYGSTQSQEEIIDISHSSTTLIPNISSLEHADIQSKAAFASSPKPGDTKETTLTGTSVKGPTSTGLTAEKSTDTSSKKVLESSTKSSSHYPGEAVLASSIKPLPGEPGEMTEKGLVPWNVYDSTQSQEGITDILHSATTVPANLSSLEHANIPSEALASSPKPGDTKETAFIGTSVKGPTATGLTVDKSTNIPHTNITTEDLSVVWIKPTLEPEDLQLEDLQIKEHRKYSIGDLPANWLSDQPLSDRPRNTPEKSTKSTSDRLSGPLTDTPIGTSWESSKQPLSGEPDKTTKRVLTSWRMYGSTQSQEGVIDISHSSTTLTPDLSSPKHTNIPSETAFITLPTPKETTDINFTGTSVKGPTSTGLTAEKSTDTRSKEILKSSTKSSSEYLGESVLASSIKQLSGEPGKTTEKVLTNWHVYGFTQSQEGVIDISHSSTTLATNLSSPKHANISSEVAFPSSSKPGETSEITFTGTSVEGPPSTGFTAQKSTDIPSKEILESSTKSSSNHSGETVLASLIKPSSEEPHKTIERVVTSWRIYSSTQSQDGVIHISHSSTTLAPNLSSPKHTNISSKSARSSRKPGETTEISFTGTSVKGPTSTEPTAQESADTSSKETLKSKSSSDHPSGTNGASLIKPLPKEPTRATERVLTSWPLYGSTQPQEAVTDISHSSSTLTPNLSSLKHTNIPSEAYSIKPRDETTDRTLTDPSVTVLTSTGLTTQKSTDTSKKTILEISTKSSSNIASPKTLRKSLTELAWPTTLQSEPIDGVNSTEICTDDCHGNQEIDKLEIFIYKPVELNIYYCTESCKLDHHHGKGKDPNPAIGIVWNGQDNMEFSSSSKRRLSSH